MPSRSLGNAFLQISLSLLLLAVFFTAAQDTIQTFPVASMSALSNLQPQPADYFLELYRSNAGPDQNKIHCYIDYYQQALKVFPNLWDAYGILGYCYHYLNDDAKAITYLKVAIKQDPLILWNYYNLAGIEIAQGAYQDAGDVLEEAVKINPESSMRKMFNSPLVYWPLLAKDEQKSFEYSLEHMKGSYQASFVLLKLLKQAGANEAVRDTLTAIKPELYAF